MGCHFYKFTSAVGRELYFGLVEGGSKLEPMSEQISKADRRDESIRTGVFDNQGSKKEWTWAWTTDANTFEVWTPSGRQLIMNDEMLSVTRTQFFITNAYEIQKAEITALKLAKISFVSFGLLGVGARTIIPLLIDRYPVLDAAFNVTYDGISEDEDLFPHLMIGREISKRWSIPFDETPVW